LSSRKVNWEDLPRPIQWLVDGIIALVLLYVAWIIFADFFLPGIEKWFSKNWIPITVAIALILVFLGFIAYLWIRQKLREDRKEEAELKVKLQFDADQRSRGLVKYVDRNSQEKWGSIDEVTDWQVTDSAQTEKESLFSRVVSSINEYFPSRIFHNEYSYQLELHGWLRREFPSSQIEMQTGASRPDIVIEDIAIEVKGPTDNRALDTLATKCLKYSQHYSKLIIVLFEPVFSESNFSEISRGIDTHFPNVKIVRKG
jgi:hypothetical protein